MNLTVTTLHGHGGAGYVGIGMPDAPPLVTIYFGVTSRHPSQAEAEALASKLLAVMNAPH